jgi:hypothetical protein
MKLALIQILGEHDGPIDPGYGRPGGGWGGPADPGFGNRPGGADPGYGRPIFHPGHPDHGLPSGGHIGNQLPWAPGHPDAGLPVPPGVTPPAAVPPDLANQIVVLWHLPGQVEWHGKVIDPSLVAGMPLPPAPAPKS